MAGSASFHPRRFHTCSGFQTTESPHASRLLPVALTVHSVWLAVPSPCDSFIHYPLPADRHSQALEVSRQKVPTPIAIGAGLKVLEEEVPKPVPPEAEFGSSVPTASGACCRPHPDFSRLPPLWRALRAVGAKGDLPSRSQSTQRGGWFMVMLRMIVIGPRESAAAVRHRGTGIQQNQKTRPQSTLWEDKETSSSPINH